ncbi:MAG: ATP-binding cassette family protein, partial [Dolichospermum sp.]
QNWEQELNFVRQRYANLTQDSDRLKQEQLSVKSQLTELEKILNQQAEIEAGYTQYQNSRSQEEIFADKFEQHTRATNAKQQKQQQLYKQIQDLERQLQKAEAELTALEQQELEIVQILSKSGDIEAALLQLNNARQHLANLDQLQMQVTPLLQQRANLQTQLDRTHASLLAQLEQKQAEEKKLQNKHHRQPQIEKEITEVEKQIEELDKKRVYLQRVKEKGQEKRHFFERLQAHQGDYEKLLVELEQKLQMLQNPDATCPLCERPLNEHHWSRVVEKTQSEYEDTQGQFWVVREQIAVSDREIQVLRQEYREIDQKLSGYDSLREKRGQLAAQLQGIMDVQQQLMQVISEKEQLETCLQTGDYAPEKQAEIQELDQYIQQLNYHEQDHALA